MHTSQPGCGFQVNVDATQLLNRAARGDPGAVRELTPLVYDELRRLAGSYLARHGGSATLQPTAVVHEAFVRLVDRGAAEVKGRTHFFALAAVALRHVLIDHARSRQRAKRGGGWRKVTLSDAAGSADREFDIVALNDALDRLAEMDGRAARVVELRFFGGLTEQEAADVLGVSERTVRNDWAMARAWLKCQLGPEAPDSG